MDLNSKEQQHSSFQNFQHLNIDLCLELIFPYLELNDLANAADTCKQMKRAAEIVFDHKYRKNLIAIGEDEPGLFMCRSRCIFKCDNKSIYLSKPKICFQILRNFGHLISGLYLIYDAFTDPFSMQLDKYVAKYCANYITRLEILGKHEDAFKKYTFENLQITFPNVEKVILLNCKLDQFIIKFNERFPRMRSLVLARDYFFLTNVDDESFIVQHIPHLEHLSLYIPCIQNLSSCGFEEETVLSLLKLNPNIRRLSLRTNKSLSEKFIRSVSEICKSLEILQITGRPLEFANKIHFKSVKMFTVQHTGCTEFDLPIPLTFDALEIFKCSSSRLLPNIFNFIRNNPTIVELSLSSNDVRNNVFAYDKIIEMKKTFRSVKVIECIMYDYFISTTKITNFLDNCKSVQRLILKIANQNLYYEHIEQTKCLENVAVIIDKKEKSIIYQRSIQNTNIR